MTDSVTIILPSHDRGTYHFSERRFTCAVAALSPGLVYLHAPTRERCVGGYDYNLRALRVQGFNRATGAGLGELDGWRIAPEDLARLAEAGEGAGDGRDGGGGPGVRRGVGSGDGGDTGGAVGTAAAVKGAGR